MYTYIYISIYVYVNICTYIHNTCIYIYVYRWVHCSWLCVYLCLCHHMCVWVCFAVLCLQIFVVECQCMKSHTITGYDITAFWDLTPFFLGAVTGCVCLLVSCFLVLCLHTCVDVCECAFISSAMKSRHFWDLLFFFFGWSQTSTVNLQIRQSSPQCVSAFLTACLVCSYEDACTCVYRER